MWGAQKILQSRQIWPILVMKVNIGLHLRFNMLLITKKRHYIGGQHWGRCSIHVHVVSWSEAFNIIIRAYFQDIDSTWSKNSTVQDYWVSSNNLQTSPTCGPCMMSWRRYNNVVLLPSTVLWEIEGYIATSSALLFRASQDFCLLSIHKAALVKILDILGSSVICIDTSRQMNTWSYDSSTWTIVLDRLT